MYFTTIKTTPLTIASNSREPGSIAGETRRSCFVPHWLSRKRPRAYFRAFSQVLAQGHPGHCCPSPASATFPRSPGSPSRGSKTPRLGVRCAHCYQESMLLGPVTRRKGSRRFNRTKDQRSDESHLKPEAKSQTSRFIHRDS